MSRFHNRKLSHENQHMVSPSPSPQPPSSLSTARNALLPSSTYDPSMILTVLLLLATVSFVCLFSIYLRRFGARGPVTISRTRRRSPPPCGLHISVVRSLPIFSYQGNVKDSVDCAVCLSEFQDKENVKVIPHCRHVFHQECIDAWFLSHVSCPLCRSIQLFQADV